jgi:leucyl-tRNA synthetase
VTSDPGVDPVSGDVELRRTIHRLIHEADHAVESFRFNVAVAKVMEMVNATRKAIDSGAGPADPAVREAAEAVAILLSLVAPYTAEDMWARLGHQPSVALAGWPAVDPELVKALTVTCVVQIAGKVKARLDVDPEIGEEDLQTLALADPAIVAALDGSTPRRVIVRAPKLVNIVPG